MMRTIFFVISLLLLPATGFGQAKSKQVKQAWGPIERNSNNATLYGIIGHSEQQALIMRIRTKTFGFGSLTYHVKAYNDKLVPVRENEFELAYKGNDLALEDVIQVKGEIYFITSYINNKQKKNYLFAQQFDKKTLRVKRDLKKLAEIDFSRGNRNNAGEYYIDFSIDSSKILVYYKLPYNKGDFERVGFHVFDEAFNEVWSREVKMPYIDKLLTISDYTVSNAGNVYILTQRYKDKLRNERKGKVNYEYVLFGYAQDKEAPTEVKIKKGNLFLAEMGVAVNTNEEVISVGFYSDDNAYAYDGSFYIRLNGETGEVLAESHKPFSIEFLTANMKERKEDRLKKKAKKGKDLEEYRYKIRNILLKEDGGVVFVSEQSFRIEVRRTDPQTGVGYTSYYVFHDNEIAVININPQGEIVWAVKIPKKQSVRNTRNFSSFKLITRGDKMHFLFNDNPKNLLYDGEGKIKPMNNLKRTLLVMVTLNTDGKMKREAIISAKESDVIPWVRDIKRINQDEILVYGTRGRKDRLGKLTFK